MYLSGYAHLSSLPPTPVNCPLNAMFSDDPVHSCAGNFRAEDCKEARDFVLLRHDCTSS